MNAESMQALESGYYQLHRELAEANETIGNLRNDLTKAQARIAELEAQLQAAQQWRPIEADGLSQHETVFCGCKPGCTDKINIWKTNLVQVINPELNRTADIVLPDDIRLCRKVQP